VTDWHPELRTPVPGPGSLARTRRLAAVECPEVTCTSEPPIFWTRGRGANVWDVDGNRFVDMSAGFGAAVLGYAHPEIGAAIGAQAQRLQHALGDVHPADVRLELLEALARVLPGDLGHAILSASGSDAVEAALETALIATGRAGVVAFEGAYHGLGLGALDATHRPMFREPFRARLPGLTRFAPWGDAAAVRELLRGGGIGAILVEPIQGRGGLRLPPPGFLRELRALADASGALLIADEVYTGLGRTGHWLACQADGVLPDVVALGKALGGGLPLSACAGREAVMRRWPESRGEALRTHTHLGNPVTCAAGLATLRALERGGLVERARREGERWLASLRARLEGRGAVRDVRGRGLLIGIELDSGERARLACRELLRRGWIVLAEGPSADVLALTPPLDAAAELLDAATDALAGVLA
jgi:4-aminobutyrate aminotransferase/(S)-3-amino-2-methylpropionate transaminase